MTSVPGGIVTFGPISLIRSPSTRMIWLVAVLPLSGSTRRPARIAVSFCGPAGAAPRPPCASTSAEPPATARTARAVVNTMRLNIKSLLNESCNLEIDPEPELLAPLRPLGEGQAKLRRLQTALVAQPIVDVEDVEHLPERGRGQSAGQPENLADAQIGALLRRPAPRVTRLWPVGERIGVELHAGADAVGEGTAVGRDPCQLQINLRHEVGTVQHEVVAAVVVVRTDVRFQIERIGGAAGAQARRGVGPRLRQRIGEPGAAVGLRVVLD